MKTNHKFYLFILIMNFCLSGFIFSQNDSIMTLDAKGSYNLSGMDYSPNDLKIAAGYDLKIIIWDAITGNPLDTINNVGRNITVNYSHDGSMIVSSVDSTPELYNANTGVLLKTLPGGKPLEKWDVMIGVSFSHDDKKIIGCYTDSTVAIWDVNTGELIRRFRAHDNAVEDALFSLDDSKIISCSYDSTIKIWDANTFELLKTIKGHNNKILRLAISPDGKKFASCSADSTFKLWDFKTGELIRTFYGHKREVRSIVFSPNGTKILSGSYDETVKLWDVASGKLLHTFVHNAPVYYVRYSPDSLRVASAGNFEKIIIWKVPGITDVEEHIYLPREDLIISPNPATDYIELSIPPSNKSGSGAVSVKIYDVLGVEQHVSFTATPLSEGNLRLDVSSLPAGVYFVRVGEQMLKFVKL